MSTDAKNVLEIIEKYDKEEQLLNERLREKAQNEDRLKDSTEHKNLVNITMDEAINRNRNLLKELELIKAKLRSKAIFSPAEIQWDNICRQYQEAPSLPVTTWRCHFPVNI